MKEYNPRKRLISIHIPRCAGTGLDLVSRSWYGENFFRHVFKEQSPDFFTTPYELHYGVKVEFKKNNFPVYTIFVFTLSRYKK